MKHIKTSFLAIPLIFISASALTWADTPVQGTKEFSLSGAGSSDKEFDNNAFALDATYGHYLSSVSEVGFRQSVSVTDSDGSNSDWNGSTRLFYDYHFGEEKLRPFLGVNIGYIYGESVEETFIAGPELGLKYYVLPSTFIVAQLEYQFLFDSANDADSRFDDGAFAYGVGIGFNF